MTPSIDIHPDFQRMPAVKSFINPWFLATVNTALDIAGAIKWFKYRDIATRHQLATRDGASIPVHVIRPKDLSSPAPALLYFHGSGFMVRQVPQHIENAVLYAKEAQCCVIFVNYRLAPKHQFPTPFNDCHDVLHWMIGNADSLGVDKSRIAVGGDSAGGALAASLAQKATHEDGLKLLGQMLVYPITSSECRTWSSTAFANVRPFKQFSMPDVWKNYLGNAAIENPPPFASPMRGQLSGLAPAYVETGEYDPWRDEGAEYARALAGKSIDVELNETKGTVHGFDTYAPNSSVTRSAVEKRVKFLRKILHK